MLRILSVFALAQVVLAQNDTTTTTVSGSTDTTTTTGGSGSGNTNTTVSGSTTTTGGSTVTVTTTTTGGSGSTVTVTTTTTGGSGSTVTVTTTTNGGSGGSGTTVTTTGPDGSNTTVTSTTTRTIGAQEVLKLAQTASASIDFGTSNATTFCADSNGQAFLKGLCLTLIPGTSCMVSCNGGTAFRKLDEQKRLLAAETVTLGMEVTMTGALVAQAKAAATAITPASFTSTFTSQAASASLGNLPAPSVQSVTVSAPVITDSNNIDVTGSVPTPASPTTASGAYTAGVAGVLALVAGAMLF